MHMVRNKSPSIGRPTHTPVWAERADAHVRTYVMCADVRKLAGMCGRIAHFHSSSPPALRAGASPLLPAPTRRRRRLLLASVPPPTHPFLSSPPLVQTRTVAERAEAGRRQPGRAGGRRRGEANARAAHGHRTLSVALAASGFSFSSSSTTVSEALYPAAMCRAVIPYCD